MAPQLGLGIATSKPDYLCPPKVSLFSVEFDGTADFVSFTENAYLIDGSENNLSISFWAKRTDNNDEAVVLGSSESGSFKRLYFNSDGTRLYIESDTNGQEVFAPVTADTNWHHYVITSAGADGGGVATVAIYEDGAALSVTNTNFGASSGNFTVNRIGADTNTDGTKEFKGLLYQVAIFDTTLNDAAVTTIYNAGRPIPLDGNAGNYISTLNLLNLWKFNEGSGTSVADLGDLKLTGTLNNNVSFSETTPIS